MNARRRGSVAAACVLLAAALGGCVTQPRASFTASEQAAASPAGFSQIRYGQDEPALAALMTRALKADPQGEVNALAVSGGGADGAYGAGLLYGWSKTGERPQFQLVTGISAGALTAPFVFLGPGWDDQLRQMYFDPRTRHLMKRRGPLSLFTPGIYSKAPLEALVRSHVTDDLLAAVAAENAKGRLLLVATTNLDTEQLIVWNMGAIAARAGPDARELFTQVLVASASVPGVFPPTMIKVRGGGREFSEMHIDGGAESPFFIFSQALLFGGRSADLEHRPRLFIVVNGPRDSLFAVTRRSTFPILSRTLDAAGKASLRAVLMTTLEFCKDHGCQVRVAALPATEQKGVLDFGADHLQSLFSAGETAIQSGQAWETAAPDPVVRQTPPPPGPPPAS